MIKFVIKLLTLAFFINVNAAFDLKNFNIDFDISLGKNDKYLKKYFKRRLNEINLNALLNLAKKLYSKNNLSKVKVSETVKIPLKIHQIWLGGELPKEYKRWQKKWQSIPGWEYKLWTDGDIDELNLENRDIYNASPNYGQRADIARIEILNQFGGLYVDTDFELLNSDFFLFLHRTYDFYIGLQPIDAPRLRLNNAIIGSIPGHPILKGYIRDLRQNCPDNTKLGKKDIGNQTGPGYITNIFLNYNDDKFTNIILPPSFFYPLGWDQFKRINFLTEDKQKLKICKAESVAIHWWETSWNKKSADVKPKIK